jgi:type III restriction enzyme
LTGPRAIPLATLMRCRFILARKLKEKIAAIRKAERARAYQATLFAADARPELSFESGFRFFEGMYDGVPCYRGRKYRFSKHFLGWDKVPAFDGNEDGEEFECAQVLDSLSEVEFWVRNVARHPNAYWLPVAGGRTYPDFVAQLKDGRIFVVEYKGGHLVADSLAKQTIGQLCQRVSGGTTLYAMIEKERDGLDMKAQMKAAVS